MGWDKLDTGGDDLEKKIDWAKSVRDEAQEQVDMADASLSLLYRFKSGDGVLTETWPINDNGTLDFPQDDEGLPEATALLSSLFAHGKTPNEFIKIARKLEEKGIARFSFEQDPNGKTLTYTAKPF